MARRQGRTLLMIDLGMPRNIDPAANDVDNAMLYDLDDLDEVAERGRERRREALVPAEAIVAEEVERFERWQAALQAAPVIRELLARANEMAREEARRASSRLAGAPEAREIVERMAEAIVAKLLHRPVEALRAEAAEGRPPYYADVIRAIFGVAEDDA
jgi:glutamyl-tRNA reductase